MRKAIWLTILALAACDENTGWNPNYAVADRPYGTTFDERTPYARYKVERERALVGQRGTPATIPMARPFNAPTPRDIAGPTLWQIIQRDARIAVGQPRRAVVTGRAVAVAPAVTAAAASGPVLARYATSMTHPMGTPIFARPRPDAALALRTCRTYADADSAQITFLAKGGPVTDAAGMDPDGDGYVCGWSPEPWRRGAGL